MEHQPAHPDSTGVLEQDLGCPECGYNLRGLGSDVVVCPECGVESDIVELITRRWDRPWYEAPGFTAICLPAAWAMVGGLSVLIILAVTGTATNLAWWFPPVLILFALSIWSALMSLVWWKLGGRAGVVHAGVAHASLFSYLLSLPLTMVTITIIFISILDTLSYGDAFALWEVVISAILIPVGVLLFMLGRRLERVVSEHCIRLYLRRPTTSG